MFLDWFTIKLTRFGARPCINLNPTTACDGKNNNPKLKVGSESPCRAELPSADLHSYFFKFILGEDFS